MNYYKRPHDETSGEDLTDAWGTSTYYFETDDEHNVVRQIQVFNNGQALKYWAESADDDYGGLSDQPLDAEVFAQYKIEQVDFENAWMVEYKHRL